MPRRTGWYNLSTHFPWIGDRTRALDGAHIEYFRGIANPIGVKIGPIGHARRSAGAGGRAQSAERTRPAHVHSPVRRGPRGEVPAAAGRSNSAQRQSRCSGAATPCTATPRPPPDGIKTRRFDKILAELETSFRILNDCGTHLGGVHFELTGDNVTECIGGASGVTEADLARDYRTQLDPRLNYEQAMEMALLLARLMAQKGK